MAASLGRVDEPALRLAGRYRKDRALHAFRMHD